MPNYGHLKKRFHPTKCFTSKDEILCAMIDFLESEVYPKFKDKEVKAKHPQRIKRFYSMVEQKLTNKFCQDFTDKSWKERMTGITDEELELFQNDMCRAWWKYNTGTQQDLNNFVEAALMYESI